MVNAPPLPAVNQASLQPVYYQIQSAWPASAEQNINTPRPRLLSADAFLPERMFVYGAPKYTPVTPAVIPQPCAGTGLPSQKTEITRKMDYISRECGYSSQSSIDTVSPVSFKEIFGYAYSSTTQTTPLNKPQQSADSLDSLSESGKSNTSSLTGSQKQDDSLIQALLPSSLRDALTVDLSEQPIMATPLKTSSPIRNDETPYLIDITNPRKRRAPCIRSSSSEKCPRFSENGIDADLDECDKILLHSRERNHMEDEAKEQEDFLLILETERERQRKMVLPRRTPKMICKFCQNNGESPEVYTKHRLHYREKTVCPLLRNYVCPLCNSTGDFAHTISYCPFNERRNKIAWKATFLV